MIADVICTCIDDVCIDENETVNNEALEIIEEIRKVLVADGPDFYIVDDIATIMNKHNISTGACHDFG